MKKSAILLLACVILAVCDASVVSDKLKEFGTNVKNSMDKLRDKLKDVGDALKDVAIDQGKGLLSQSLQAVAGAFIESFKGMSIGKRSFDLPSVINSLVEEGSHLIGQVFEKTFSSLSQVLQKLHSYGSAAEVETELTDILDSHKMAVRGIFGDTLNSAIDTLKKLYNKSKDLLSSVLGGSKPEVADPVMISKREFLQDAWRAVSSKVKELKQKVTPKVEKVSEIATNLVAALKHHAGRIWEHTKEKAGDKVQQTLGYLSDELQNHLDQANDLFKTVKDELTEKVHSILH